MKKDGIETETSSLVDTALRVRGETRKILQNKLYLNGFIELQDAGSQALVAQLDCPRTGKVLDYCAGGGGKTLAIASLISNDVSLFAYDKNQSRLKDLKLRAQRSSVKVHLLKEDPTTTNNKYDLVIVDVPCSGSGSWRRSPDAKWKLQPEFIDNIKKTQEEVLEQYSKMVKDGGKMVYATCSILPSENETQVQKFLTSQNGKNFKLIKDKKILAHKSGFDGFYMALLEKNI